MRALHPTVLTNIPTILSIPSTSAEAASLPLETSPNTTSIESLRYMRQFANISRKIVASVTPLVDATIWMLFVDVGVVNKSTEVLFNSELGTPISAFHGYSTPSCPANKAAAAAWVACRS
jgi:hypothetical protein